MSTIPPDRASVRAAPDPAALLRREDLLVLAIGNDRRGDDGLGWAFGRAVEQASERTPGRDRKRAIRRNWEPERRGWRVVYRYQLQVEDAALVRDAQAVLFVDAHAGQLPGGPRLTRCEAATDFAYTTHTLHPCAVLGICKQLYGRSPDAWLLELAGGGFDLGEGLSGSGRAQLAAACERFELPCPAPEPFCNINEILTT